MSVQSLRSDDSDESEESSICSSAIYRRPDKSGFKATGNYSQRSINTPDKSGNYNLKCVTPIWVKTYFTSVQSTPIVKGDIV